ALLETEVKAIEPGLITLETKDGEGKLKNDRVIVSVGGELPTEFLKSVGVNIRKHFGEEKQAGGPARGPTKAEVEARTRRRLAIFLFALGSSLLTALFLFGRDYYTTPVDLRDTLPNAQFLRPAGLWGHGVGVGATTFMIFNFAYAMRKRWRVLKGSA